MRAHLWASRTGRELLAGRNLYSLNRVLTQNLIMGSMGMSLGIPKHDSPVPDTVAAQSHSDGERPASIHYTMQQVLHPRLHEAPVV
jgi:hypothetical protein